MRVGGFEVCHGEGLIRLSAIVRWEDSDRPPTTLFFETEDRHFEGIEPNPESFLVAAFLPAMCLGERRVAFDGTLCPRLEDGLRTVMLHFSSWYGFAPLEIEARRGARPGTAPGPRVGSFQSGGVDALATLRRNRLRYPLAHPGALRDALFVLGLEGQRNAALVKRGLERVCERASVSFLPVATNANQLDSRPPYQAKVYSGAFFASVAHLFSKRISTALIASSHHIRELEPWGTHPLIDPNYSSEEMTVRHDGGHFWRLEKVALVAGWDAALEVLRPCWNPYVGPDELNCGWCEKCLRTSTELLVCGKLELCPSLPPAEALPERIAKLNTRPLRYEGADRGDWLRAACLTVGRETVELWRELVEPLRVSGRAELSAVVREKVAQVEHQRPRAMSAYGRARERISTFARRVKRVRRRVTAALRFRDPVPLPVNGHSIGSETGIE